MCLEILARINHHISSNFEFALKTPPRINFQTSFTLHWQLATVKSRFFRFGKAQERPFLIVCVREASFGVFRSDSNEHSGGVFSILDLEKRISPSGRPLA